MSKSRFSGGTLGNGRWDEEEHPRGKDGRFAVADGGSSGHGGEGGVAGWYAEFKKRIEGEKQIQEELAKAEGYWKMYVKGEIISDVLDNRLHEVDAVLRKQGFTLMHGDNGYFARRLGQKGAH